MPKIGTPFDRKRCKVSSMKPSPPSGMMISARSGGTQAYRLHSSSRACRAVSVSAATPAIRGPVMTTVNDEVVAARLAVDRFANRGLERLVPFGLAQRGAQIRRILLAETHIERPGAGHADAVAALAEIMGQRSDKAEPAAGLAHRYIARRTAGAVIGFVKRPTPLQPGAHQ